MALRDGLGVALRAIRSTHDLAQTDLGGAAGRSYVQLLEHGRSDVTLGKLEAIGKALDIDALTLLVLSASADRDEPLASVIQRIEEELAAFREAGGMENLADQINLGPAQVRVEKRESRRASVQECKAAGMTQRQTAEKLQLAKSTVADFWSQ
ncbi:helix-turn-helix transcriptional regulator [Pseudomonas sp. S75]|uniref:helix-turn-helix domain-containing protein n=1 Tax=unclassified Pseudomonas TaxID=196821 RepID=UPI00190745C4|nr:MULTISPECIES: helix-turn-helix transcriptional regulator [unclassified Pseudomonas]MBJ9976923.1 helix-turn-helix transcriptional regulator [Pseudomonas sp. S30]MBK0153802.1 helix-turn-helix transcriptional regulator [Pseudomonas sp. S75]